MNGQVGGRYAFVNLELSEEGEGRSRINEGGNRSTMNHTLVLSQIVADVQMNTHYSAAYFAQLETE